MQRAEMQNKHDHTVEIHPSWTYKEIGSGTAMAVGYLKLLITHYSSFLEERVIRAH